MNFDKFKALLAKADEFLDLAEQELNRIAESDTLITSDEVDALTATFEKVRTIRVLYSRVMVKRGYGYKELATKFKVTPPTVKRMVEKEYVAYRAPVVNPIYAETTANAIAVLTDDKNKLEETIEKQSVKLEKLTNQLAMLEQMLNSSNYMHFTNVPTKVKYEIPVQASH